MWGVLLLPLSMLVFIGGEFSLIGFVVATTTELGEDSRDNSYVRRRQMKERDQHISSLSRSRVDVQLWDAHENEARGYNPLTVFTHPPRYLVGKVVGVSASVVLDVNATIVGSTSLSKEVKRNDLSGSQSSLFTATQHITFDLGNPKQPFLVVDECRACPCRVYSNGTVDNCPKDESSLPTKYCTSTCWPSRPNDSLNEKYWRPSAKKDQCVNNETNPWNHCMQCFSNGEHSRYYIPAEADNLYLMSTTRDKVVKEDSNSSNIPLGSSFQFAALTKIIPVEDRIWGNFGIGYNSTFLQEMNFSSILLHLRIPRRRNCHVDDNAEVSRCDNTDDLYNKNNSFLEFNPTIKDDTASSDYFESSHKVPFELDDQSRRVHDIHHIGISFQQQIEENFLSGTTASLELTASNPLVPSQLPVKFHIDTGNNGIAINDTILYNHLAQVTHGQWWNEDDTVKSLFRLGDDERIFNTDPDCHPSTPNFTSTQVLFVPFSRANAPSLKIAFSSEAIVTLPGPSWVLSDSGATIFFTYHKNVLGLPVLACTYHDFLFDDKNQLLYVIPEKG